MKTIHKIPFFLLLFFKRWLPSLWVGWEVGMGGHGVRMWADRLVCLLGQAGREKHWSLAMFFLVFWSRCLWLWIRACLSSQVWIGKNSIGKPTLSKTVAFFTHCWTGEDNRVKPIWQEASSLSDRWIIGTSWHISFSSFCAISCKPWCSRYRNL